jgi:hypothetical protein
MEALLIWEALLAHREERAPSFSDIVQRLRASYCLNPDLPNAATLDVLKKMGDSTRQRVSKNVLQNWTAQESDQASLITLAAIEQLLKESIAYEAQSRDMLAMNERAKQWRKRYWRKGDDRPDSK